MEKVYLVYRGKRDGRIKNASMVKEKVNKVFKTMEKAIEFVTSNVGFSPENGYAEFNTKNFGETFGDYDYEFYFIEERDLE